MKHTGFKMILLLAAAILATSVAASAAAPAQESREPEILVELARQRIYAGESVLYLVTMNYIEDAPEPDLGAFTDFEVRPMGSQDINSYSYSFVNGRRTERRQYGKAFRYMLIPLSSGTITVPAPTAEVDGKTLRGRELILEVIAPQEQDLAILSIDVEPDEVYLLQPFTVTLEILVKERPPPESDRSPVAFSQAPALTVPWVELPDGLESKSFREWLSPLASNMNRRGFTINDLTAHSALSFFDTAPRARFDLPHERVTRRGLDGEEAGYFAYRLSRKITAAEVGEYSFGPVTLKGLFATGVNERTGKYTADEVYAVARAVKMTVTDAPEEGRPGSYTGAVGSFTIGAELAPRQAKVGDPVTLTLTLAGDGTLDRAYAPDIALNESVAAGFKVYDATEETKGRNRIFTYSIRPLHENVTEFPPVAFSYFDVGRERYVTEWTDAIPLQVEAADQLDDRDIIAGDGERKNGRAIESRHEGIFANVMDLSGLRNEAVRPERWAAGMAGMAVFYGVAFLGIRAVRRRYEDPSAVRRRSAAGRARTRLKEARVMLEGGNAPEGLEALRGALSGFLADMEGSKAEGMTHRDLGDGLQRLGLREELADELARIHEQCEAARYGMSASDAGEIGGAASEAFEKAVQELGRSGRLR